MDDRGIVVLTGMAFDGALLKSALNPSFVRKYRNATDKSSLARSVWVNKISDASLRSRFLISLLIM